MSRPRMSTLVGGLSVMALGAWILLDAADTVRLSFGGLGAALACAVGLMLLASGLGDAD